MIRTLWVLINMTLVKSLSLSLSFSLSQSVCLKSLVTKNTCNSRKCNKCVIKICSGMRGYNAYDNNMRTDQERSITCYYYTTRYCVSKSWVPVLRFLTTHKSSQNYFLFWLQIMRHKNVCHFAGTRNTTQTWTQTPKHRTPSTHTTHTTHTCTHNVPCS